jgi:hypothetical protein
MWQISRCLVVGGGVKKLNDAPEATQADNTGPEATQASCFVLGSRAASGPRGCFGYLRFARVLMGYIPPQRPRPLGLGTYLRYAPIST